MYVYIRSERDLWTVGFYSPNGEWHPESDHGSTQAAAERVAFLNGGHDIAEIRQLREQVNELRLTLANTGDF